MILGPLGLMDAGFGGGGTAGTPGGGGGEEGEGGNDDEGEDEEEGEDGDSGEVDIYFGILNTGPVNLNVEIEEPVTSGGDVGPGGE